MNIQDFFAILSFGVLGVTLVLQIYRKDYIRRFASRIFLYSAGITFAYLIYVSFLQYRAFELGVMQGILGTASGFTWFLGYVRLHFWNQYLIALLAAILFLWFSDYYNRKYGERFFEPEERYVAATGIFLVGYPGWIFYIILVLFSSSAASAFFLKRGERLPLYYFWMPTAIALFLLINFWIGYQPWWASFRF